MSNESDVELAIRRRASRDPWGPNWVVHALDDRRWLLAEVDRLREHLAALADVAVKADFAYQQQLTVTGDQADDLEEFKAEVGSLRATVTAVRELHRKEPNGSWCVTCTRNWPCPTSQLVG